MSDDLVAFIAARLEEDQRIANACEHKVWTRDGGSIYGQHPTDEVVDWVYDEGGWEHIARHDPARVLREVEAKRRILEWAQDRLHDAEDFPDDQEYRLEAVGVLRLHLPLLAAPYSDHPDFQSEWLIEESSTDG